MPDTVPGAKNTTMAKLDKIYMLRELAHYGEDRSTNEVDVNTFLISGWLVL